MTKNLKEIIYSIHPLERKILPIILTKNSISDIRVLTKLSSAEITTGLQLLENNKHINIKKSDEIFIGLDKFGLKFVESDLPEILFLKEILNKPKKMSELKIDKELFGSALGILKRENLINIEKKDEMIFSAKNNAKKFISNYKNPLKLFSTEILKSKLNEKQKKVYENLKKRNGFVCEFTRKSFSFNLTKIGNDIAKEIKNKYLNLDLIENIDSNILKNGNWKNKEFRHYDININTINSSKIGRRHPTIEANNILRDVFIEMGFSEMQGPMVESAFWNMDTMWIPQDHPARDEQDTFYLDGSGKVSKDVMNKVKKMHEIGLKKTHTKEGEWSEEITKKLLLRTHSTSTTFRTLYELGKRLKKGENIEGKYFYLANVFRNEAIDATHLAEFYQGEGFIIGENLSLADLMGFIKEYYSKLGIDKIKFKPTFNPYTEPSMEAHYYDSIQKKWYALINSGIFRQETLEPLGLKGKSIIAWGMGASRVAALLAKKDSMKDITGATCDFNWLKNRPIMQRKIVR